MAKYSVKQMLGAFEQVCNLVESAEKSRALSNGIRITFEFDQTFSQLPYTFALFSERLGVVDTV